MLWNCLVFHTSGGISLSPAAFPFLIFLRTESSSSWENGPSLISNCLLIILVAGSCVTFGGFPRRFSKFCFHSFILSCWFVAFSLALAVLFILLTSLIVCHAILDCLSCTESLILSIWFWRPCIFCICALYIYIYILLLYGCTTWTLTKRLEKKLHGNYTWMLWAILNKSWQQHPTRHQLYGHLPPITKIIQARRTRHAGHWWRRQDLLISDVLLWIPAYGQTKAGRPARTYIQQLCEDTGCSPEDHPEAMNDWEK